MEAKRKKWTLQKWERERKPCSVLFAMQQTWILSNHTIIPLYRLLCAIIAEMWDKVHPIFNWYGLQNLKHWTKDFLFFFNKEQIVTLFKQLLGAKIILYQAPKDKNGHVQMHPSCYVVVSAFSH